MTETPNTETAGGAWTRRETLAATVHFTHPDTGEEIGPIYLPYEEGNPPSEEEVYAQAWEYYSRIEHIRGGLKEKTIEAVATELRTGGIGKWMARELRTMLRDGVKVAAKPGDGATPEEIAEDEATAAEMNALLHDKGDELTGALLEESPRWREFAEDALSQSWAQALGDFLEEHPDAGDWPDDRFDSAVRARYQEGDYFTGATLNTGRTWIEIIARDIAAGFEEGDGKPGPIASGIEEKARARVRKRMPRPEIPIERAIFGEDGYALIPSDVVSNGLRRATLGGPRFWAPLPDTGRPEGRHDIGLKKAREAQGRIFFGISEATYPTPEDAFSIVRGLGLAHWDVFSYVMARWLEEGNRGPYGGVYVSAERFLDSRGLARHKRAHRPEYVSAFYTRSLRARGRDRCRQRAPPQERAGARLSRYRPPQHHPAGTAKAARRNRQASRMLRAARRLVRRPARHGATSRANAPLCVSAGQQAATPNQADFPLSDRAIPDRRGRQRRGPYVPDRNDSRGRVYRDRRDRAQESGPVSPANRGCNRGSRNARAGPPHPLALPGHRADERPRDARSMARVSRLTDTGAGVPRTVPASIGDPRGTSHPPQAKGPKGLAPAPGQSCKCPRSKLQTGPDSQ